MPLFTGGNFSPQLDDLAVGLSQVLFPIVVILALTGLVVGILNAHDHFTVPALSPLVWNIVIIGFLVVGHGWFEGDDQLYAYAIGILAATIVQLLMVLPVLKRVGFELELRIDLRDPRVKQVLMLMLPVTLSLGLINFNAFANSLIGALVSEQVPRAIEAAFRVYMLPQGLFSVAIATVLFPTLARLATRGDLDGDARPGRPWHAVDLAAAAAGRGTEPGARRADHAAALPAGRVRRASPPRSSRRRSSGSA